MIKSFHQNLKGKIKIMKPRPTGNEIKNLSDAVSNIVLNLELYEGKEIMSGKDFFKVWGYSSHNIMTDTALRGQLVWLRKMCLRANEKGTILSYVSENSP